MCTGVELAAASLLVGAASAGASYMQGQQAQSQQKKAAAKNETMQKQTLDAQEQDMNRRNQKKPNVAAIGASNQAEGNANSTLLSGVGGIDLSKLTLGSNTLLGA